MQNSNTVRLCHIYKWYNFEGYGFNLHAEKGKPGQYIGKVDEGSPAEAAGLKEGDRIIEVNGINISQDNHKQVVQRIKALKSETKLLVVDAESDTFFKAQNVNIHGGLPCVVILTTPASKNHSNRDSNESENNKSESFVKNTEIADSEADIDHDETMTSPSTENGGNHNVHLQKEEKGTTNSLCLNMTAKELRAQLAARPRYDPKTDSSIDLRKKYDIVQKL